MPIKIVFSTASDQTEAEQIATALVEEGLVACVNILPGATSIYTWQGVVERAQEAVLLMKTQASQVEALIARLKQLHSYEVPECIVVSVEAGYPPYLKWVEQQSRG